MRRPKITTKTRCGHCGARIRLDRFVFSRHTATFYCIDESACEKRAKKRSRA